MNPIRQHGQLMKNRVEKAGGHVKKKKEKMLVGILAALLCMATGVYGYFRTVWKSKSYHHGRYSDKYDRVCAKRKRRSEIS